MTSADETPLLGEQEWGTDSFNLVGFAVDPPAPPTFGSWLNGSPAHAGQRAPAGNPTADGKTPIRWHNQLKIKELSGWISIDADSVDASLPPS